MMRMRDGMVEAGRLALAGLAGATIAFFLDPDRGRRRRTMTRDRGLATIRRGRLRLARLGRGLTAQAAGRWQALTHRRPVMVSPNDATLAHKVETRLFRDPAVPKGQLNISAENGVVVLHGTVDRPEQIKALEEVAGAVPGVRAIDNRLRVLSAPPSPAPATQPHQ